VGVNGQVWVKAPEIKQTIAMVRCIEAADPDGGGMDAQELKQFLDKLEV
jgi:exosome complex component RRP40